MRRRRLAPWLVAAALMLMPADRVAGQTRSLDPGTRVRVRLESQNRRFVALVTELRPDTLVLVSGVSQLDPQTPFAVADIAELEVSGGRRRLTAVGAAVGMLAGMVVTATYNGIVQSQCFSNCPDRASLLIGAAVGGLALGTGLHFLRVERWLNIALPARGETRVGVHLSWVP